VEFTNFLKNWIIQLKIGSLEYSKIKLDCSHIDDPVEGNNELIYGGWIILGARETITTLSLNMHKAENHCLTPWITDKK
jgi:hypothetical protein